MRLSWVLLALIAYELHHDVPIVPVPPPPPPAPAIVVVVPPPPAIVPVAPPGDYNDNCCRYIMNCACERGWRPMP